MGRVANPRITKTVSFASNTKQSPTIDLEGYRVMGLQVASGWDAVNLMSFRGSNDGATFYGIFDSSGTEITIASGAAVLGSATQHLFSFNHDVSLQLSARRYLQIQSGPTTASVTMTTTVAIDVILVPF